MSASAGSFSLQRRLLLALLGSIALVWFATVVFSYFDARDELGELLDAHLAQSASLLLAQTGHEAEEIDTEHMPQLHKRARKVAIQMWESGSVLRLHSASAPATRLSAQDEGFSDALIEGKRWRVFSAWDARRQFLIQVGERYEARDEIAADLARNLLLPLLFALPLLGLLVWFNVARALRPLAALGVQVAARDPANLGTLDAGRIPAEVAPLVENLNRLFGRVAQLIESERRFTADASHELRTPLAALKIQAQVARASAGGAERTHALDNVIAGCDRATHLVQQLLTLARLDPEEPGSKTEVCDLQDLAIALRRHEATARTGTRQHRIGGDGRAVHHVLDLVWIDASTLTHAADAVQYADGLVRGGTRYLRGPGLTGGFIDEQEVREGSSDVDAQSIAHACTCIGRF